MKRREFVQYSTLTGSLMLAQPSFLVNRKKRHVGVQLWSIRDAADKDLIGTLEQLARMGYTEVEGYKYTDGKFYGYTPTDFSKVLKHAGLKMTSAHTGVSFQHWNDQTHQLNDLAKKTIDDHAALGVKQLICPYIDEQWRTTDHFKQIAELFHQMGASCKMSGIQFGYHNHDFEFKKIDGSYIIDFILGQTDPTTVIWEMDLYWVKYANEDPAKWIHQYGERIRAFHVKDMADSPKRESIEVGDGSIDFERLFKLPEAAHVDYYFVELEDYRTTSMEGVATSLHRLDEILARV